MNRQFPERNFHPLASCTLVAHQYIVVHYFKRELYIASANLTNLDLSKIVGFVPEAPIHKVDGFRIESGRIFEGQIFTFPNLIHNFYWFHMSS
jgi:hypothetical protein